MRDEKNNVYEFTGLSDMEGRSAPKKNYPVIYTDDQPRNILKQIEELLIEGNEPPSLFRWHGQLARVRMVSGVPSVFS